MIENNKHVATFHLNSLVPDFSKYDETFLRKILQKRIKKENCISEEAYFKLLEQNEHEAVRLIDSLHINYSEFFRNSLTFAVLEKMIFPTIISKKTNLKHNEIRVWSAACAGGQEVYSLAILLNELKNIEGEKINFRIFATDYSQLQVEVALKGQYSANALNNVNLKQLNQWFVKQGNNYIVKPELKENIEFSVFDLFNEEFSSPQSSIFGDFDLVVCANLFFYYKPEYQHKILDKASKCLANGGFLVTGETERKILMQYNFEEVYPQSAIFRIRG